MKLQPAGFRDEPEISLTSLIDVVFTLIIFFVVTTTFDDRAAVQLELPEAGDAARAPAEPDLVLVVDADGRYFIGANEVLGTDSETLQKALQQALDGRANAGVDGSPVQQQRAILRADARTPHQAVVTGLDALGKLGLTQIAIATVAPEEPAK